MTHTHLDTAAISYHAAARYTIRFEPEYATDRDGDTLLDNDVDTDILASMYRDDYRDEYLDTCNEIRRVIKAAGDMAQVKERGQKSNHPRYWINPDQMVAIAADGGIVSIMRPRAGVYNG